MCVCYGRCTLPAKFASLCNVVCVYVCMCVCVCYGRCTLPAEFASLCNAVCVYVCVCVLWQVHLAC